MVARFSRFFPFAVLFASLAVGVMGCDAFTDDTPSEPPLLPGVLPVDANATGDATGTSWENAYTDLQGALDSAEAGDEVWIATGIYVPSEPRDPSDERTASFVVPPGVVVYGGFSGDERERQERTPDANTTILSGDRGAEGELSDNAYHVVMTPGEGQKTRLEDVTIQEGNANGEESPRNLGGGIYDERGELDVRNVVLRDNRAAFGGAVFFDTTGARTLEEVTFEGNRASTSGGGAYFNDGLRVVLTNGSFRDNEGRAGGGLLNEAELTILGTVFEENTVSGPVEPGLEGSGGGLAHIFGRLTLRNVEFVDNQADDSGGGAVFSASSAKSSGASRTGPRDRRSGPKSAGGVSRAKLQNVAVGPIGKPGSRPKSSSPTALSLEDVTFQDNSAAFGGGVYNQNTSMVMNGATFANNEASEAAGGLYNRRSDGALQNVTFENNQAGTSGGGVFSHNATASAVDIVFRDNQAGTFGGGLNVFGGEPTYVNTLFASNIAGDQGGGIGNLFSQLTLRGVTIIGNSAQNGGDALQVNQGDANVSPDIVNSILWGNGGGNSPEVVATNGAQPQFVHSIVQGSGGSSNWNDSYGIDGGGNADRNPEFADGSAQLTSESPAIDAGIGAFIPQRYDTTDLNDNPRIVDGNGDGDEIIDMGAYEYQP